MSNGMEWPAISPSLKSEPPLLHIGFLLFPNLTLLDLTGPLQFFSKVPNCQIHLVSKEGPPQPIKTDCLDILPTVSIGECPPLDVVCVPGGHGVADCLRDAVLLHWVRVQAASASFVTSVCTGAFILGAAGLLRGKQATTHFIYHGLLPRFGAIPVQERVVRDGKVITGGGVTAGIDFAILVVAELVDETFAQTLQLALEYDPQPPFPHGAATPAPVRNSVDSIYANRLQFFGCLVDVVSKYPELHCSVCSLAYEPEGGRAPRTFACAHTLCEGCIFDIINLLPGSAAFAVCPICEAKTALHTSFKHSLDPTFPLNGTLVALLSRPPPSHRCSHDAGKKKKNAQKKKDAKVKESPSKDGFKADPDDLDARLLSARTSHSPFYCHDCRIQCLSEIDLRSHLQGKKHKARISAIALVSSGESFPSFDPTLALQEASFSGSSLHADAILSYQSADNARAAGKKTPTLDKRRKDFKDFVPPMPPMSPPSSSASSSTGPHAIVVGDSLTNPAGFTSPMATNLKNHKPGSLFSPSLYCAICKIQSFSDADHLMHLNGKKHQLRVSKGTSHSPALPICHNCQNPGHTRNECTQPVPTCHHCRELGHSARDCPKKVPV